MPHLVATLIYLSQIYSYYIRGDRSPLTLNIVESLYDRFTDSSVYARGRRGRLNPLTAGAVHIRFQIFY